MVLAIREATLRRQAERHLIAARDAAESARQSQAVFLVNVSHELRTPLNGILGFAQLLLSGEPLTERHARGLTIIEESGQHLLMLIDAIFDLARIDKASLAVHPVKVGLPLFLLGGCDMVRVKAEEMHLAFVCEVAPNLPELVFSDEMRLRQVLLNRLSNAIKFSDGGQVALRASAVPPKAGSAAGGLHFEVEDQDIGMNDARLARRFRPFAQVAEPQRRAGGTGLGLFISRQLVRLMGGDLQAHSRQGRGRVFSFDIEAPSQPAAAVQGPRTRAVSGARLLVVEDNAINRELLTEMLNAAVVVVSVAGDGRQALEMLDRQRFDAVLRDGQMPVMDGHAATRALRLRPELRALPVIALTASTRGGDRGKALAAGTNDHIAKPVQGQALVATLERWVRLAGAASAAVSYAPARNARTH